MKQTINLEQFRDAFRNMDRLDNFSYEGLKVLFNWFEEYDESCDHETELDVIAICCEFNESTREEIIAGYQVDSLDEFSLDSEIVEYLNDHTLVCGQTDTTIIYQAF